MEHAEAHEMLADLALEPARLRALDGDLRATNPQHPAATDRAFHELERHVAGCDRCLADVRGWLRTWAAIGDAPAARQSVQAGPLDDLEPILPPDRLRVRTLAAIRKTPQPGRPASQPAPPRRLWRPGAKAIRSVLAVAAVLAIVLAGTVAIQSRIDLGRVQSQQSVLSSTAAALDRILATPSHQLLSLHAADGSPSGTLAWSDSEFVVLTSSLNAPAPGQEYRCWINVDGHRTILGSLSFTDRVASWSGSMSGWQWEFVPGAQFGVSLYGGDGSSAAPVLVATFPSR